MQLFCYYGEDDEPDPVIDANDLGDDIGERIGEHDVGEAAI